MRVNPAIIIPTHNDGRTIETTVRKAKELSSFIIVIDDGSTDGSGDLAKRAGAIVLKHGRNLGKGAALETGFRYAGSTDDPKSELIVTLDADGQHDPADIPKLLAMAEEKRALVIGNRFTSSNVMPPRRALGNRLASWIISLLIGQTVSDTQSGFRAFPVEFIKNGPFRQRGYGIETEMIFRAKKLGMPIEEVPIQVHDANMRMRTNDTKNRWNHLIKDIWRGINLGQAVITSAFSWKALIFPILLMLFFLQLRLIVNPLKNDISRIQAGLTKRRDSQTDEGTLAAFKWLKENTPSNAIILTPPYEAHRIMAFSDRRVIAGGKVYPSETKELASRLRDLSRFFFTTDTTEAKNVAQKYHANYIFLPKKPLFLNLCAAGGGCHWATYSGSKDLTPDGKKKTVIGRLLQGEPLSEFMLVRSLSRYLVFSIATSNPPLPNFGFTDEALRSRIKTSLSFLEKERPTTQT
ncbi:MAG: glycosyltransferase, partial [Parcubacteria group bacterium]|nr:glycosyltransferase [Parcubacteria group bacterium]